MSNAVQVINADDAVLEHTRQERMRMLESVTENGTKVPASDEDRRFVLALCDGLDRQAVAKKRIKVEEKVANNAAAASSVIAEIYSRIGGKDIFSSNNRVGRIPDDNLVVFKDVEIVEGELDLDPGNEDYKGFMERTDPRNGQGQLS